MSLGAPHYDSDNPQFIQETEIIDAFSDGVAAIDRNWNVSYVNRTGLVILGPAVDPLGRNHWECFPQMVYEGSPWTSGYHAAMDDGQSSTFEAFYGEPHNVWVNVRAVPARNGIIVFFRDIGREKQFEAESLSVGNNLQQVLSATTDAIAYVDRNWRVTYLNEAARQATAAVGTVLGKTLTEAFPGLNDPTSPFMDHNRRAMLEGKSARFTAFYGEPLNIWIDSHVEPAADGIVIFFRDVTQQKQTDEALLRNEKLAAVGRLASSIAHEINNPLEAVTNLLYIVQGDPDLSVESKNYLRTADRELGRIANITAQTLRFHRQSTEPVLLDPGKLIQEVLDISENRMREGRVAVRCDFKDDVRSTCFDGDIRQVLNNLIGNAFAAMPLSGTLTLRTRNRIHCSTGRAGAMITIADTGRGMAPEVLKNIFEAFYSTKGIHGTGLGLWISKRIVHKHRGHLRVRSCTSESKHGTIFTLWLPRELAPSAQGAWQL